MVPFDDKSAFVTSGIRVGVPAITTRGMKAKDMSEIVDWINEVLTHAEDDQALIAVRRKVNEKMKSFPLYPEW